MRVGICLETVGTHGGIYQYSIALLTAMESLNQEEYHIVGICLNEEWNKICEERGIEHYYTQNHLDGPYISKFRRSKFVYGYSCYKSALNSTDFLDCKKNSIDVCIFACPSVNVYCCSVDAICPIHDMMHREEKRFPEIGNFYSYITRDILYKRIVKKAKAVLVDSEIGKRHVEKAYFKNYSMNKIKILPFIAPDYIYNYKNEKPDGQWYNIESILPDKFFFYPAQFWKHKNHINLLKAYCIFKEEYGNIKLVFAGSEKNGSDEIKKYIEEHHLKEDVFILGYVTNYTMIQLYMKALALIMPSYCGPTNIPQLEAFYLGCPVAVADVYAVAEQVGNAALLFKPDKPEEIAMCMKRLIKEEGLAEELKERGNLQAKQWGPEQFARRLDNILAEIRMDKGR